MEGYEMKIIEFNLVRSGIASMYLLQLVPDDQMKVVDS